MIDIFSLAEQCLFTDSMAEKLAITEYARQLDQSKQLAFASDAAPKSITLTQFPAQPIPVYPRDLPKRGLNTIEGRVALLHAVAHIEFNAIHLAWDHLYRFRDLPENYYRDWLRVAIEEALHFTLLRTRLGELGADYGDLPAHRGLWELAVDTAHDVLARLALIPRFMEARGLDVTPDMIRKFEDVDDDRSVSILQRILQDEVGHVATGTRWFRYVCQERGIATPDEVYFELMAQYLKKPARGPFNYSLRKAAGFSEAELARLDK
jgi:uncharacterized ferritin-like protein (DUF455 family)